MKKSLLVLLTAFGMNALVAQTNTPVGADINGVNPPGIVTNKFRTDYPNVTANWQMDGDYYSAEYRDQATNMGKAVIYDRYGNIIRTDNEMNTNSYPTAIGDYYTKNYPKEDYRIWSSDDGKGNKTFYSKRKSETIWFDKDGKYTSKKSVGSDKGTKTNSNNTTSTNTATNNK